NGFAGVTYATAGSAATHDYPGLSAATHTIYARIIDKDDGFTQYSTDVAVNQRPLTLTASAVGKTYDGTTAATVSLSDDHLGSDNVTETYTSAVFDNKNAGTGKTVTVS